MDLASAIPFCPCPRSVTATATEWRRVRERANAAGMPVSRYVCERAMGPERRAPEGISPEVVLTRLERIETAALVLTVVERQRLAEGEGWEAVSCCVPFTTSVTAPHAIYASGWQAVLCRAGVEPAGSR